VFKRIVESRDAKCGWKATRGAAGREVTAKLEKEFIPKDKYQRFNGTFKKTTTDQSSRRSACDGVGHQGP
jgi:hypothetical protein